MSDWTCANCGKRSGMMGHYSSKEPSGFYCEPKANGGKGAAHPTVPEEMEACPLPPCPFCDGPTERLEAVPNVSEKLVRHEGRPHCPVASYAITAEQWVHRRPTVPEACPSCHGLNTSCPDGCGRDPLTGELNGTCLERPTVPEGLVEQIAQTIHAYCSRNMIMAYLDAEEDCEGLARAIVATLSPASHDSRLVDRAPNLCAAFRTTVSEGDKFTMVFRFPSMEAMHKADDEWRALRTEGKPS